MLKEIPEDPVLCEQWNTLVQQVEQPEVFYTYEWALAVQRAYKTLLPPLVLLGYDSDEKLIGVVAFAEDDRRKTASFLSASTGDYCDFISEPGRRGEFVSAVFSELQKRGIENAVFTNLPVDSATFAAIRKEAPSQRFRYYARTAYICAQVEFSGLEVKKDGNRVAPGLKRLRRFEKAMASDPVRTEHLRSWETVEPILSELFRAHVARFLEVGRLSNLANPDRQLFLQELAYLLSMRNWLVVSRMLTGSMPVAWHFGFQFHNKWFWYQPTFNSSVEKHWPGFCLLSQVIQDALQIPSLNVLDLGLGAEAYKAKFANASRETLHVTLSTSLARHWAVMLRHRCVELVRSSPRREKIADSLRQSLRRLGARIRKNGVARTSWWMMKRLFRRIWGKTEVHFFKGSFSEYATQGHDVLLNPLTLKHLAEAAMVFNDDEEACAYLVRSAKRLRSSEAEGWVLTDTKGQPLHFAWVAQFNGFYCAELDSALNASEGSVLIFDCWTPDALRGNGYYEQCISLLGSRIQASGRDPWIFSATSNTPSMKGIEKAGYEFRYSMICKYRFGQHKTVPGTSCAPELSVEEVATRP